jgi:glycosyltransferase involved in cell wall biosynthesis
MRNTVLMIAFHFPPAAMGSGHLRTLGFARYLPALGWDPIVLSARAPAYPRTAPMNDDSIPPGCLVHRAFALDARHLGLRGKYPGFLAQPDRWISWWPAAIWRGLQLIRRHRVRVIWSTYPIMSAHCIARTLSAITGLPWVADFRDPVASSISASNPYSVASQLRWERRVLRSAARIVFTTQGALDDYAERFPGASQEGRLTVIANGYEENAFSNLPAAPPPLRGRPLVLLHSGLLYAEGRNPVPFFEALARLKASGSVDAQNLKVVLRASGFESTYARAIQRLGLDDIVTLAPSVSYKDALAEQAEADALLLFQGNKFDRQIPAKLYEYLRIGRPIFALVGEQGDTAKILRNTGGAELVPLNDAEKITTQLAAFIAAVREGRASRPRLDVAMKYSRKAGANVLARMLHEVSG